MNKYHNRNRIFNPIMTIHDILTLHILSSFIPLFLPFLSLSFLPLFLTFLFPFSSSSLSLPLFIPFLFPFSPSLPFLLYLPSLPLSLSVFSVFYREGRTSSHHPDVERYCARLSE